MNHIVRDILASAIVLSFLALSISAEALTLSAAPGTPTSTLTTYINGADRANFPITVPLETATTGAVEGDTLELFVNGARFPIPVTGVLSASDISADQRTFTLSLTFANNLSNGVKNFTAALSSNGITYSSSSPALTLTLDTSAPTLSPVSVVSNNTVTTKATTGNVVTLSFTASEGLRTPTVTLAGRSVTPAGGPLSWTASTTMLSTDGDGIIPFSISYADLAGNVGTTISSVRGGGQNVVFDRTAPVISSATNIVTSATTVDGTSVSFAPTAVDGIEGSRPVSCNFASGYLFAIGTTTVSCTSADSLGNSASASFTVAVRTFMPLSASTALTSGAQQAVTDEHTLSASTISVPSDADTPTLNFSPILTRNSGVPSVSLGGAITVSAQRGSDVFSLLFPSNLTITGPSSWNGVFKLPTLKASNSVTVTPSSGNTANNGSVIEVGSESTPLTLDRAIRLLIPRAWSEFLGKSSGGVFGKISAICNADDQDSADAQLSADGDCRTSVGMDIVLWTKRPGSYVVYSETPIASSQSPAGGGGGGGGGGGTLIAQVTETGSVNRNVSPQTVSDPALVRPADIQRDGAIDILDFNSLMVGWGTTSPSDPADTNGDGQVDILDFNTLMVYWGSTYQLL
ncbi:HYR domain-containing protein [Candidatus Parcubacteria bacterium]|nr:HYR domain-containing protein [Candidatus Parcubacteria bacterium]